MPYLVWIYNNNHYDYHDDNYHYNNYHYNSDHDYIWGADYNPDYNDHDYNDNDFNYNDDYHNHNNDIKSAFNHFLFNWTNS